MQNVVRAIAGQSLFLNKLQSVRHCLLLMIVGVVGFCSTVAAAPSNLDPTFGTLGKVVNSPDGSNAATGNVIALQPDGKIVMVGNKIQSSAYAGLIVARYNTDGSLDTSFGTGGWASVTFGARSEFAASVALQADGKILVGGTINNLVNNIPRNDFYVVRFNADGSLDTTFDGDGKLFVDFNPTLGFVYNESLSVVRATADGKILVAGVAVNSGVDDKFIFARLNADGSPDTGFGTNGFAVEAASASNQDALNDLVILPDGKFVIAGRLITSIGGFRVAIKFSAGGVKEWRYQVGQQSNLPNDYENLREIKALPNGKFIVAGKAARRAAVLRLNADGTQDDAFINQAGMPMGQFVAVDVQADGKIVAVLEGTRFQLVRFNSNGALDTSFGVGGFSSTNLTGGSDYGNKLIIQPDGKYLVGGSSTVGSPSRYYFAMARYLGASTVVNNPLFDYDGDGRADASVFRASENKWYVLQSSDSAAVQKVFALSGDVAAPADYDGDGKTDVAIFRPSTGDWWYLSSINNAQVNVRWGQAGDIPRPSDFDGDGRADFIVYRPSNSVWYRYGSTGATSILQFGIAEDKPLVGDFDGDRLADFAVFRPSTGDWWYAASSAGNQFRVLHWGAEGDVPAPADYDGDGKTDFAVFRPSEGGWYVFNSSNGSATILTFGSSGDKPIAADYDGDGKADIAVFRPSTGIWYLMQTSAGFGAVQWGNSADTPTPSSFLP